MLKLCPKDQVFNIQELIESRGRWQMFSVKDQTTNTPGFASRKVSIIYLALQLQSECSHRQYKRKCAWLCSNKTLFTKLIGGQIWPTGCSLLTAHVGTCSSKVRSVTSSIGWARNTVLSLALNLLN